MRYLQRAWDLADARGYFRYSEVLTRQGEIPGWFRDLGTETRVAAFEAAHGVSVPAAMREFYAAPLLACFLEAAKDGEVFLNELALTTDSPMPPLVNWSSGRHLVFAFHGHSQMVFAARLGADDPHVSPGFLDEPEPIVRKGQEPLTFSGWVFARVDGYEQRLDHYQKLLEECERDPTRARNQGGLDSVRASVSALAGMAERLGQRNR
jgi:hypothetical protein